MPRRISKKDKKGFSKRETVSDAVKPATKLACPYCKAKKRPSYLNVSELFEFITDRGKILSRLRNGLCAKHQRLLSREIKKARHLAFLPFVIKSE